MKREKRKIQSELTKKTNKIKQIQTETKQPDDDYTTHTFDNVGKKKYFNMSFKRKISIKSVDHSLNI